MSASLAWGAAVGGSLVLGALGAAALKLPERIAALLTAFGGGILLAAVALELIPEADAGAGAALTAAGLLAGMAVYVAADAWLSHDQHREQMRRSGHAAAAGRKMTKSQSSSPDRSREAARGESIAAGLFVDGVPESIALGLTIAEGEVGLALLVGILLGNVVEAYGASQPIVAGGHTKRFAIGLMAVIGVILGLATLLGGTALADVDPQIVGTAQAVAAGAVLAVVSIAIIPHAFSEVNRAVAAVTVLGFAAGYLLS